MVVGEGPDRGVYKVPCVRERRVQMPEIHRNRGHSTGSGPVPCICIRENASSLQVV